MDHVLGAQVNQHRLVDGYVNVVQHLDIVLAVVIRGINAEYVVIGDQLHVLAAKLAILTRITRIPGKLLGDDLYDRGILRLGKTAHVFGPQRNGETQQQDGFHDHYGEFRHAGNVALGAFMVGAASASGYQARFAAIDLATPANRSKNLSLVVWGSTVGAVTGPNLMQPAGDFAHFLHLPRLVGPYFIAGTSLTLATIVIFFFLKPDPYLTANMSSDGVTQKKHETTRAALKHIRQIPHALFAITAVGIGHLAMVSIMVMTPVHMSHVDVTLSVIGLVISVHVLGMYAFSPLVGALSDRLGRVRVIQIGVVILMAAAATAGLAPAMNAIQLGIGLFLLGLGWSCTLIAGSTLLSETVSVEMKPSSQGASDLVMNLMGAVGGAASGVIIGFLSFGWLCFFIATLVFALGVWSFAIKGDRE